MFCGHGVRARLAGACLCALLGDLGEAELDELAVDFFGIVRTAIPVKHGAALGVSWGGDGLQEGLETRCSADVLGRTASGAFNETGIGCVLQGRLDAFDLNRVAPVVAEVVGVGQGQIAACDQGAEFDACRALGGRVGDELWIGNAIMMLGGLELPQMIVLPAHRRLDQVMQALETGSYGRGEAAPDRRLGVVELHADDGDVLGAGHSPA